MALIEELQASGNWLFRWRSYLPITLLVGAAALVPYKETQHEWWGWVCLALSAFGMAIRVYTIGTAPKGTSGRNTGQQVAHDLNRTGFYSVVRHPLYLGNFFAYLGVVLYVEHPWFLGFFLLAFWLYYERIMLAEEAYLRGQYGDTYLEWAKDTPAFIPRLHRWRGASLSFSPVTAIAEEYGGIFAVIFSFGMLRAIDFSRAVTDPAMDTAWGGLFAAGLGFYVVVRVLKKLRVFKAVSRR